jgi:branched-chain amino acid transport system substrate-binding protein
MFKYGRIIAFLVLAFSLGACGRHDAYTERLKTIEANKDKLYIALAWPYEEDDLGTKMTIVNGINMAVDEVNSAGGVLGRTVEIKKFNDGRNVNTGLRVAQDIAEDKSLLAIISHLDSYIAIPTSTTYELSGLININPGSTDPRLTASGHQHLLRMLSTNPVQGAQLAQYFNEKQFKKILIYYINNPYGQALANSFEKKAKELGIEIVGRRGYYKSSQDHSRNMRVWSSYREFDAIFLAGSMPEGPTIVKAARDAGITQPIYAGAGLDSAAFTESGGEGVDDTHVVSFFPQNYASNQDLLDFDKTKMQSFVDAYTKRFGLPPVESTAALAYDSINLLVDAIKAVDSLDHDKIVKHIRANTGWTGAAGPHNFNAVGDVEGKLLVINQVVDGKFVFQAKIN